MKEKFKVLTFFFVFLCSARTTQSTPSLLDIDSLSIEQAVQNAFLNRSSLKARNKIVQERNYSAWAQLSGYFPRVNVKTRLQRATKSILASDYLNRKILPTYQTFIEIRQFIVKFGGPFELYRIGKQEAEIATLQEAFEQDAIQFETEQSLLILWTKLLKEQSIQSIEQAAVRQFAKAQVDQEVGFLNLSQWINEQALLTERMATVQKYPDELGKAYVAFERAIEQPLDKQLNISALKNFVQTSIHNAQQYPLDFFLKKAYLHRKDLLIKEEEIIREEWREKFFIRSYLPSASFFANIANGTIFAQTVPPTIRGNTFWEFGLLFEWNFDGLGNAYQAGAAQNSTLAAILQKKDLERQINVEVQTNYYELQKRSKYLNAAQLRIIQQQQEFERKKAQHLVGELSDVDWATAQKNWEKAQFNLLNLEQQTAIKQRELLFSCGYPPLKNDEYTITI
ncbi:MAG: TolC family protein [bacterium]|nr:TolC family protein [bacterium]